jgi:hypothetical protein
MAIDIRQFLAEDGLSKEEIDALVGSPATAKAMTRALSRLIFGLRKAAPLLPRRNSRAQKQPNIGKIRRRSSKARLAA